MEPFTFTANPSRVIFGAGCISQLPVELQRLDKSAALVLSTPGQAKLADIVLTTLGSSTVGKFTEATMHTPIHVTEKGLAHAIEVKADSIVSIGGGSTIGLGKAISIRTGLPHICIPTTYVILSSISRSSKLINCHDSYAGSEMTPILGETVDGVKTTRSDPKILPATVIYDVDFTMTLPAAISSTSGVNAIAHAVEALYAKNTNPVISLLALDGIKSLAASLPVIVDSPQDKDSRLKAFYGAWLCGLCLGSVGMSLHHKLCHTLGGTFNLPHANVHTIVLPHALAYNSPEIPEVMKALAGVFPDSNGDAIQGLNALLTKLKVERGLAAFGMKDGDVDKAADIAVKNAYWNPRKIERDSIRELIRRAWAGDQASADL